MKYLLILVIAVRPVVLHAQVTTATSDTGFAIFICPDAPAQFPGGTQAMKTFIAQHIFLPKGTEDIDGRVILSFYIDKTGLVDSINVIRSLHPQLDTIAIDIVHKMPRWKPARWYDKPKACRYTLPIRFLPE